jgi:hypothetical protein
MNLDDTSLEEEIADLVEEKISKIPEVVFPKVQEVKGTIDVSNLDEISLKNEIDLTPVIRAIEKIKIEQPKQIEQADYTLILDDIIKLLERPNVELAKIIEIISNINNEDVKNSLTDILDKFPELKFDDTGRLKVNIDKVSGGNFIPIVKAVEDGTSSLLAGNYPAGASANGTVTLTLATTAYSIPASASAKSNVLIIYNGSDTDMYIGYDTLTSGGILLPSGGVMNFDLGANQVIYAYCGSAGKIINYTYKEIL